MIDRETAIKVYKEHFSKRLGREITYEEAEFLLKETEKAYRKGLIKVDEKFKKI